MRVAELWNRLSREVMDAPNSDAPSSDIFKVRLDVYWSNLSQLKMSLVIARGLDSMTYKCSFQPKSLYNLMILCFTKGQL